MQRTQRKACDGDRHTAPGQRADRLRSLSQTHRLAATSMVAHRVAAAATQSTQDVAAGVRWAWASSTRVSMAAPMAATAAVSGRWASITTRFLACPVDHAGNSPAMVARSPSDSVPLSRSQRPRRPRSTIDSPHVSYALNWRPGFRQMHTGQHET
jgi:hypothetical protein